MDYTQNNPRYMYNTCIEGNAIGMFYLFRSSRKLSMQLLQLLPRISPGWHL